MDLMCFAGRVPQLCFPAVARGVWPTSELICFPNSFYKTVFCLLLAQSCSPAVFSILFPNTCSPIVFPSLSPTCFPDCCFPALPKACPQLYPSCFQLFPVVSPACPQQCVPNNSFVVQLHFQLIPQNKLCCPACSHLNFQLLPNGVS